MRIQNGLEIHKKIISIQHDERYNMAIKSIAE